MKETKLYERLRPHFASWGECDRVENSAVSGMSDVFYNFGGYTGWVETKIAHGSTIYFEKFQPNWISRHHRQGARIFVIAMDDAETIHVYPAGVILKAPRTPYRKWTTVQMTDMEPVISMPKPYRMWASIKDILIS